jgi:hypothetical protein
VVYRHAHTQGAGRGVERCCALWRAVQPKSENSRETATTKYPLQFKQLRFTLMFTATLVLAIGWLMISINEVEMRCTRNEARDANSR